MSPMLKKNETPYIKRIIYDIISLWYLKTCTTEQYPIQSLPKKNIQFIPIRKNQTKNHREKR